MSTGDELAIHLGQLNSGHDGDAWNMRQARNIRHDPQAHIDALVAAGLLTDNQLRGGVTNGGWYRVIPPPRDCRHCGEPIEPWTFSMETTSSWRHTNGQRQCLTLAAPAE